MTTFRAFSCAGPAYRGLYDHFPFYVPESGKSGLQILLCIIAIVGLYREKMRGAFRELGLTERILPGLLFGLAASSPMLIGFALTTRLVTPESVLSVLYLALVSPFAEELLYRGFAFRQLYRRLHLPLWLAILVTAAAFGYGHVEKADSLVGALGVFTLTGTGAALLAWFFARWGDNLWAPFSLHASMNLWWEVFQVNEAALGGWYPFALQTVTMLLAIGLTLKYTPRRSIAPMPANSGRSQP